MARFATRPVNGDLQGGALHQFEAISEGIEHMDAAEIVERCVGPGRQARAFASRDDFIQVIDHQGRVGSLGGMEIGFNSEVKIHETRREPHAVPGRHGCGLRDFG